MSSMKNKLTVIPYGNYVKLTVMFYGNYVMAYRNITVLRKSKHHKLKIRSI